MDSAILRGSVVFVREAAFTRSLVASQKPDCVALGSMYEAARKHMFNAGTYRIWLRSSRAEMTGLRG